MPASPGWCSTSAPSRSWTPRASTSSSRPSAKRGPVASSSPCPLGRPASSGSSTSRVPPTCSSPRPTAERVAAPQGTPPGPDGFAELTLQARDLEALERFYVEVLGLEVLDRQD